MSFNLPILTQRALASVFRLGPPIVREGVFHRPQTNVAAEASAACKFIGAHVWSVNYLGLAPVVPGTENLLIRASELIAIPSPSAGDYIVENASGLRRNVSAARLDPSAQFYVFQCVRSSDEDWGDLTVQTISEDFGDLTAANAFEDRMNLN
jgi:hypothetical protein